MPVVVSTVWLRAPTRVQRPVSPTTSHRTPDRGGSVVDSLAAPGSARGRALLSFRPLVREEVARC